MAFTAEQINEHLAKGGAVQITTYAKSWIYRKRHAGMFIQKSDGLYVRRGKSMDYLGNGVAFPQPSIRFSILN